MLTINTTASNATVISTASVTPQPGVTGTPAAEDEESASFSYVLIPVGIVALILVIAATVIFLIKKSRLDRLRHHLMPLYNFDPAEEGEDWESELLESSDHRIGPRTTGMSMAEEPKLAFRDLRQ